MDRRSLGIIAVLLIALMGIVAVAGLDDLPRDLRKSVAAAPAELNSSRAAIEQNRKFLETAVRDNPDLFRTKAADWTSRLDSDRKRLDASTAAELAALQQLGKANRRRDADKVRTDLAQFERDRQDPVNDSAAIRAEAEKWITWKRELPERARSMRASYDAINGFDIDSATAQVRKAMADWPAKRPDLEQRLNALTASKADAEKAWDSVAPLRAQVESGKLENFDYASFFNAAERLESANRELKQSADSLNALAAQLYTSWDKILVDAGRDRDQYREKFRIVKTKYPDATLANGQVTNEEKWEPIGKNEYKQAERAMGMTVERKPAGKYDTESEKVTQPPAYAYIAPPGQSNAYGSWSGGVWHWLPQYLILRELLRANHPINSYDWDAYQSTRRSGGIFYGRNNEYRPTWTAPNTGSRGWSWGRGSSSSSPGNSAGTGWSKERPKTWGSRGYSGSQYQNRGGYSGSRYQSRGGGFGGFSRGGGGGFRGGGFRGGRR